MHNIHQTFEPWLLPDGIEEVLPDRSRDLEQLRRRMLDVLHGRGYDLVMPPLVEYLESLLTGVGEDLDLQTVKVIDQLTGRTMGVRADHTPQVARIDAHLLRRSGPARLCYIGSVLHARPAKSWGSRQPIQVGAELFGCAAVAADCEVIETMLEVLQIGGVDSLHLGLGHVGIYRTLAAWAGLNDSLEALVLDAVRRKSRPDVETLLQQVPRQQREAFTALTDLHGEIDTLGRARKLLGPIDTAIGTAVDELQAVIGHLQEAMPDTSVSVDLAELRGYRYHTGLVFAGYARGVGAAIAQGGRYDGIGDHFGRRRSATGFSADLREIVARAPVGVAAASGIIAPRDPSDQALREYVRRLRSSGERVLTLLPGEDLEDIAEQCDRRLQLVNGEWRVVASGE